METLFYYYLLLDNISVSRVLECKQSELVPTKSSNNSRVQTALKWRVATETLVTTPPGIATPAGWQNEQIMGGLPAPEKITGWANCPRENNQGGLTAPEKITRVG